MEHPNQCQSIENVDASLSRNIDWDKGKQITYTYDVRKCFHPLFSAEVSFVSDFSI